MTEMCLHCKFDIKQFIPKAVPSGLGHMRLVLFNVRSPKMQVREPEESISPRLTSTLADKYSLVDLFVTS